MEAFQLPAVLHEIRRQPVEQGRMRRGLAQHAEVARGPDEAAAEVMQPEPVHQHPGGEGMLSTGEPLAESKPPAGRGHFRGGLGEADR